MTLSPSLRCSPGMEFRAENHKRGRSLDGGLFVKEKDDDLALFNDMQMKEKKDNFLLESTDDLGSLSMRLRYFSTSKPGISIPVRGESSNLLLDGDGDKNDYDWLVTPPGSPLFNSLDDETPSLILPSRGRPRSQPVTLTRSATMEKSQRASRSSASPHRLSPSPRSGNSVSQSRGRPSSASRSSPTPALRPKTPSRSPSNPPNKPSSPTPRSSTPTFQRMNSGLSSPAVSSERSGISPVKTSRGNSPSSKLNAWQSGLPGFSLEAPPNLRTSLADRPASYVRGTSPASRNGRGSSPASRNGRGSSPASRNGRGSSPASREGRDSSLKSGRQSMSPTASRSASSSYSHDRDLYSSQSKGSVASSGDDDTDSLQSIAVSVSSRSTMRKVGVFPNSRTPTFSKKVSKTPSSTSAPKRSFDSALRQLDKKSPPSMFRPLLSSVPSTTLYLGKANSSLHPTISRNSSVATSSNESSEQGASVTHNTEGNDPCPDDTTERGKAQNSVVQTELFISDKVDGTNGDVGQEIHDETPGLGHCEFEGTTRAVRPGESENLRSSDAAGIPASTSGSVYIEDVGCRGNMAYCYKCGQKFSVMEMIEENERICSDCCKKDKCLPLTTTEKPTVITRDTEIQSEINLEENRAFNGLEPELGVAELTELAARGETLLVEDEVDMVEQDQSCSLDSSLARSKGQDFVDHLVVAKMIIVGSNHLNNVSTDQQLHYNGHTSLNIDVSQGAGISSPLKRSGSNSKSHFAQGSRAFSATNTPYDDLSYARDSLNKMRSSIGHSSVSATSSLDLSSSKQEVHVQRQLSGSRSANMENYGHDLVTKHKRSGSSFSEISNHSCQTSRSTVEERFNVSDGNVEYKALQETPLFFSEEQAKDGEEMDDTQQSSFIRTSVLDGERVGSTESHKAMDSSASESSHTLSICLENTTSVAAFQDDDCCISSENAMNTPRRTRSISDIEQIMTAPESSLGEDAMLNSGNCGTDVTDHDHTRSLLVTVLEELENCHGFISETHSDCVGSPNSECSVDDLMKPSSVPTTLDEEESRAAVGYQGQEARSHSMEESSDTLLFCSSIVQNLAYQAATIAIEKENSIPLKGARPTVNLLGKTSSDRKDLRSRTVNKRPLKSQKARQKRLEVDEKILSTKTDTNINIDMNIKDHESMKHPVFPKKVDTLRPPNLESKCNCTVM